MSNIVEGNRFLKEDLNKLLIMPKMFSSFLCIGMQEDGRVMLVKKIGEHHSDFVSVLLSSLLVDRELLDLTILAVTEAVAELNRQAYEKPIKKD